VTGGRSNKSWSQNGGLRFAHARRAFHPPAGTGPRATEPADAADRLIYAVNFINLLNRQNAGAIQPELEYDPTSDRPRVVEHRDESIPRLPTIGLRFSF